MGFSKTDIDPPVPIDVLGTSSMSLTTECSQTLYSSTYKTLRRGDMLGIIRPYWIKVAESEQRLAWLQTMVQRELVVRDLESFAKALNAECASTLIMILPLHLSLEANIVNPSLSQLMII